MFFVHILYHLYFHLLLNSIKWHSFICGFSQILTLSLDKLILVFNSLLKCFHIWFNIVNILDSFLSSWTCNIWENLLDLLILELKFFYLLLKSSIFAFEFDKFIWLLNVFKDFAKFIDKLVNAFIESFFDLHQAVSDLVLPLLHDIQIVLVTLNCQNGHLFDFFKVFHLHLITLINIKQFFWRY